MPDPAQNARIQFLDDSARLLHAVVPETSAHLVLQRNAVAEEYQKPLSKAELKDFCKVCGIFWIPDVTLKSEILRPNFMPERKKRRKAALDSNERIPEERAEQLKMQCLICRRITVTSVQTLSRKAAGKTVKPLELVEPLNAANSGSLNMANGKPASANASSKKRAKARKQGGLQALLEKSKGTNTDSASLGLDLMDFMKKT